MVIANLAPTDGAGAVVVASGVSDVVGVDSTDVVVAPAGGVVTEERVVAVVSITDPPQAAIARMRAVEPARLRIGGAYAIRKGND